jgi:hypothetical protein
MVVGMFEHSLKHQIFQFCHSDHLQPVISFEKFCSCQIPGAEEQGFKVMADRLLPLGWLSHSGP